MALTYTLIGTPFSAATIKARLCLRWANLPMIEKPATMSVVQTYIKPRLKTVATPAIVCSDQTAFTDTRFLLDALSREHAAQTLLPETPAQRFASDLLEAWSDSDFSQQAEYIFWVSEREQAEAHLTKFLAEDSTAGQAERRARLVVAQASKHFSKLGLNKAAETSVLSQLDATLMRLDKALGDSPFLFGDRPAMAEFSLAGAVHVLVQTRAGADLLDQYPRLGHWRMRLSAVNGLTQGDHRKASSSPSAFMQLLRQVAQDYVPRALNSASAVSDWAEANPGVRALPEQITLGGSGDRRARRKTTTNAVWSPRDAYWLSRLGDRARPAYGVENAELYRMLKTIGLLPLRDFVPPRDIVAQNHRLELTLRDVQSESRHHSLHEVETALMLARQSSADIAELTAIHV